MPKYKNNTGSLIVVPSGECGPVESGSTVTTKGYIRNKNGLTLIDHDVQRRNPFTVLMATTIAAKSSLSDLELYDTILIKNFSGADVTITPNGAGSGAGIVLADAEIMTIQNMTRNGIIEWSTLSISGTGTDPMYIYGYKED